MTDLKTELAQALKKPEKKTEKLKKAEVSVSGKNGGKRSGSGRKMKASNLIERGIKKWVDDHVNENVKIEIQDPKTGKSRIISKPRVVRVLEMLYEIGVKDRSADALNKWLDRALGKAVTVVGGDDDKPIVLRIDF